MPPTSGTKDDVRIPFLPLLRVSNDTAVFRPMISVYPREYEMNFNDTDSVVLMNADEDVKEDDKVLREFGIKLNRMDKYPDWVMLQKGVS